MGRSSILIKDKKNILLDYGIKLDHKTEYPLEPGRADAFVLSHAHIDHSGFAPALFKTHNIQSFGTPPTIELSELLINDTLKIAKKNHQQPPYFKRQAQSFSNNYIAYDYGVRAEFDNYYITLYDAGHISGSAITLIENANSGKRIVYTGDFKITPQLLQGSADIVESDILITESTYATRSHPDREKLIKTFVEDIKATLDNNGTALVPVFAVGRSQEILAILYQNHLIDYVFIDGMAKKATEIAMKHPRFLRNIKLLEGAVKSASWVEKDTRHTALKNPSIVVTTAGMLTGGPVLNYITKLNSNSKIFFTGYQTEGTNGRKVLDGKPITIDGKKYLIKTPHEFYDFSAHAGKEDLYEYVRKSNPEHVICVHGDKQNTSMFAESLKLEGFDAYAPSVGERISFEF